MAAGEGRYFYSANGGTVGWPDVSEPKIERVGETRDGLQIDHFSFIYNPNGKRKTYLTVRKNGLYYYVFGSGFDTLPNGKVENWSMGGVYSPNDIRNSYSTNLNLL